MEDQYLRRGLRLKSVSTAFQQLVEVPGSRRGTRQLSNFTLTRTVSSGPKLAAFDFGNQHILIIIHDQRTGTAFSRAVFLVRDVSFIVQTMALLNKYAV